MPLPTYSELAKTIDHSLLKPTTTMSELEAGVRLARDYDVASVCLLPYFVARSAEILGGSSVLTTTTIGFPHGGQVTSVKAREAERSLDDGARELDMVVNVSRVLSGDYEAVHDDIRAVLEPTRARGGKLKVIFENCYLNHEQMQRLCEICGSLSVDWVKTSTGFGASGATVGDVALMRRWSPAHVAVKASGGIRELDAVLRFREAGASRVGTSATREILDELRSRLRAAPSG